MAQQQITVDCLEDLLDIVMGLVKRGLTFHTRTDGTGWIIELTGGF